MAFTKEKKEKETRDIQLETIDDLKALCRDVIVDVIEDGDMSEKSGRLTSLMHCWMKAEQLSMEVHILASIEKRLAALENGERTFIVPAPVTEEGKQKQKKKECKEATT